MENNKQGMVVAVCRSVEKGTIKKEIPEGRLLEDHGLKGDAHSGKWHRQVSLLAEESIDKMRELGLDLAYGDFAENITTRGLVLHQLPVGTRLKLGDEVLLEVTQIGKKCHQGCDIFKQVGKCIMPTEGIFTRVLNGGMIKKGDNIQVTTA